MKVELLEDGRLLARGVPASLRGRVGRLAGAKWRALEQGFELDAGAAAALDRAVPSAEWEDGALALLPEPEAPVALEDLPQLPDGLEPEPYRHQREAFADALVHLGAGGGAGLWVGMGGGKSRVAVNVALERKARDVLVTCTRAALDEDQVWQREFQRWAPDQYLVGGLVLGRGGKPKNRPGVAERLRQLEKDRAEAEVRGLGFVAVVPWDSYWRGKLAAWLLSRRWDLWVQDEDHKIKAPGGKASMYAARLRDRCDARLGQTGNPIPHSRLDAYGVYRALDPSVFGTNYSRFKARYARTVPLPNAPRAEKVIGWQNEDEFDERFHSIAYVWETDREVLGLEEPIWLERRFTLEAPAAQAYHDLDQELIADIGQGIVVAGNALTRVLRLQQVLSGVVTGADGEKIRVGREREKALAEVFEEIKPGTPIVVVCRFHPDLDAVHRAAESLKRSSVELSGRVSGGLAVWKSGGAEILALQIQAGSESIDLTRARYCVLASVGPSLGDYDQVLKRLDRPGQKDAVIYVKLLAQLPGGVPTNDQENYDALGAKQDGVLAVLRNRQRRPGA